MSSSTPLHADRQKNRIRTAIIGYGESGRLSHAYGIQANPEFEIVAVCDSAAAHRDRAERELKCAVYPDHGSLLSREQPDLVAVVTRSDTHCAITCDCLDAGADTIVTKPWALNSEEGSRMITARDRSGRRLFPWIPMYWSPDYRMVRKLLDAGAIGKVFLIRRYYTDYRRRQDWQIERRFGGGYLLNWGTHIIQPVLALADSPLRRVFGQLQQTINPGDADDNFLAVLEFANGVRGVAEFTQSLIGMPSFLVQGTGGTIVAEPSQVVVKRQDPAEPGSGTSEVHPLSGKQFGDEAEIYRDIARCLLDGAPFPVTPEIALAGTRALDAVRTSHELRQVVNLDGAD